MKSGDSFSALSFLSLPAGVQGYTLAAHGLASGRRACVSMFEEAEAVRPTTITRSRETPFRSSKTGGRIVVTDGTGSFYKSRTMIQTLFDFGTFGEITAFSSSVADSKKMILSRQSRYSGLNDALSFEEGEFAPALDGASAWLAINADESTFAAQVTTAKAAGISRVFVLLSPDGPVSDVPTIESVLSSAGVEYTVMRTGSLVGTGAGGGLKLDEVDVPTCEDVAKDDVFRFVTEALSLPEAAGRVFSLCPSTETADSLRQVRYAGYERRDEVKMLLTGLIKEPELEEATPEETAEKAEAVMRSAAEVDAEREEELKMLLARARKRGEETQAKMAYLAKEKEAHRKEQEKYYKAPLPEDQDGGKDSGAGDAPPADDSTA